MFSIDQSTATTSAQFIEVGITENVVITDIAVEDAKKDGSGGKVLRVHLEDENGNVFTHTEFEPKKNTNPTAFGKKREDPEKRYEKDVNATMSRIKHIVAAFVPADKIIIKDAPSWEALLNALLKVIGNAYEGRKFRIKLVLNSKDYPSFPRFVREGFIEPMEVTKTALRINEKYDRLEHKEATNEEEFGNSQGGEDVASEFLPDTDGSFAQDPNVESVFEAPSEDDIFNTPQGEDPEEAF